MREGKKGFVSMDVILAKIKTGVEKGGSMEARLEAPPAHSRFRFTSLSQNLTLYTWPHSFDIQS